MSKSDEEMRFFQRTESNNLLKPEAVEENEEAVEADDVLRDEPAAVESAVQPRWSANARGLLLAGWTIDQAARKVGVTAEELRARFGKTNKGARSTARREQRATVVGQLMTASREGKVSATRTLLQMIDAGEAKSGGAKSTGYVSKKETAKAKAKEATREGGLYAPAQPPRLVVNNG